jgi:hypothetical protein
MKKIFFPGMLLLMSLNVLAAPAVRTSIDVQADITTSVRIYVDGNDVTNGVISLKLEDRSGYMSGTTPEFLFIGNASSVSLSLHSPGTRGLVSENNDIMLINTAWVRPGGSEVSTSYPYNNISVYPTIQDAPPDSGVKVRFSSAARSETFPLGTYSGTYEVIVSPTI